ncbi:MAG: ammonium transporter [Thermoleophilia bacterium]|nr:ammonium transporter [Thermoleophilia bacterium]
MHAGFAFLEAGSVRKKNIVNALTKIPTDWAVSTIIYFLIGFPLAYGITFFGSASSLMGENSGFDLAHFFFLICFAAVIPAIISGGVAERMKFGPQVLAGAIFGYEPLGGMGGVSFFSQLTGTLACIGIALVFSGATYGLIKKFYGIRLTPQEELLGSDLCIHAGKAYPEELI